MDEEGDDGKGLGRGRVLGETHSCGVVVVEGVAVVWWLFV